MSRLLRPVLAGIAASFIATAAFAAASSVPADYTPDPSLKTASKSNLTRRIQQACMVTQARLQDGTERAFQRSCGCYASTTLRSFTAEELQDYRDTGIFNGSARDKALQAIDACGLQRPI